MTNEQEEFNVMYQNAKDYFSSNYNDDDDDDDSDDDIDSYDRIEYISDHMNNF
jgi:hypothetical protein